MVNLSNNLLRFLLRRGTRPDEWGTQRDSNSLVKVCNFSLLTITPSEAPWMVNLSIKFLSGYFSLVGDLFTKSRHNKIDDI